MSKPRVIAFYLPQFYPTPENDKWWGKGFTEWTNVAKAKPLYKGHYQPHIPADLGFYDLRVPQVREAQAQMARAAGIEGFCYWHYWFDGRRILNEVFAEVLENKHPDFPFCLCWANHSWYKKNWTSSGHDQLLIEQTYPGLNDYESHFNAVLPAFKDERYMKVDGKPIFAVFNPLDNFDKGLLIETWNKLAQENGFPGIYFVAYNIEPDKNEQILSYGFDGVAIDYIKCKINTKSKFYKALKRIQREVLHVTQKRSYLEYIKYFFQFFHGEDNIYPVIVPNFDHSPRSGKKAVMMPDSTPKKWGHLCKRVFELTSHKSHDENLVFVKAWNEWGEGNHLEPDLKYGHGYLDELKSAIDLTT